MKALILAAGFGNRMRPLTDHQHKTLLKVNGEAIIDRIMDGLIENNILDVFVVTGYMKAKLTSHLQKKYTQVRFSFVHNERYRETNNIYSMALAFESMKIHDELLLIESDLIFTSEVITKILKSKHDNVALVSPYAIGMDGTVVELSGHKVKAIHPPHLQGEDFNLFDKYKTLNIYKFSASFCNNEFSKLLTYYAKVIDDNCYYELILGILIYMQRQDIYCEILANDQWAEVDDPNDLQCAEFSFAKDDRLSLLEKGFGGFWNYDLLDFCFIRNMHFPSDSIIAEVRNNLPNLIHNYGSKQNILDLKLSYVLENNFENLLALNGAAQIYPILENYLEGKKVLLPTPTFGEYPRIFKNINAYSDQVGLDEDDIINKIPSSDVVVIVNPNNPTGSLLNTEWIYSQAQTNSDKLFIVDESFIEFSSQPSIIKTLEETPLSNMLVIKSMSKSYGVPGVRLGFVYSSNEKMMRFFRKNTSIWNMNSVAEFYLELLLKNKRILNESFLSTIKDRELLTQQLQSLSAIYEVYPSEGNFILIKMVGDSEDESLLVNHLLVKHSIYIKDVTNKFSADSEKNRYYRIAVRLPHENKRLVESISKFYG